MAVTTYALILLTSVIAALVLGFAAIQRYTPLTLTSPIPTTFNRPADKALLQQRNDVSRQLNLLQVTEYYYLTDVNIQDNKKCFTLPPI